MQLGGPGATGNVWKRRLAEPQARVQVANFVAKPNFCEAVETVAEVGSDGGVGAAINHQRISSLVYLELRVAGGSMWRYEPIAHRGERFVKFAGNSVNAAEAEIASPFRTIARDVRDGQPRGQRGADVGRFGAINFGSILKKRRRVAFFMNRDQQARAVSFRDLLISDRIKFSSPCQAGQQAVQRWCIERFADQALQRVLEVLCRFAVGTFDADKLRRQAGTAAARRACVQVIRPVG